jgi:hypothetical protein
MRAANGACVGHVTARCRYTIAWERVSDGKAKRKGQAKDEADAGQRSKKKARADADADKNK